jgi:hypothetical protein
MKIHINSMKPEALPPNLYFVISYKYEDCAKLARWQ